MYSTLKEEEKNREQKVYVQRGDSYKSSSVIDEKEERINETFNLDYIAKKNFEENRNSVNVNKNNLAFNLQNKKNMPVRLRYNNSDTTSNIIYIKSKQNLKKSVEIEDTNKINEIKEEYNNNEEDIKKKNKKYVY